MASLRMRKIVLTGAAALALLAGGTAAGAAIVGGPIDGSGVIHGCYYPSNVHGSSRVVLQDTTTSCPAGSTPISWNQTGPQGPQGATGAVGPQGPAGVDTAGPSGLDVVQVSNFTNVDSQGFGQEIADCPADHPYVVGGGGLWTDLPSSPGPAISQTFPFGPGGWAVEGFNNTAGLNVLEAWAICAK
jgi:hypothetical protein